jgi:hypothetical protein
LVSKKEARNRKRVWRVRNPSLILGAAQRGAANFLPHALRECFAPHVQGSHLSERSDTVPKALDFAQRSTDFLIELRDSRAAHSLTEANERAAFGEPRTSRVSALPRDSRRVRSFGSTRVLEWSARALVGQGAARSSPSAIVKSLARDPHRHVSGVDVDWNFRSSDARLNRRYSNRQLHTKHRPPKLHSW